jgi:hemerythrin-like domain-containing protein
MKRPPALQPLSRDHHQALFVAQKLRRASVDTVPEVRAAFLAFWRSHGRHHFRCEEEILLPAYAEYGDPRHPLVTRVLTDHVVIRQRAAQIERGLEDPLPALKELGVQLADHVRLEESELFPLIEEALPQAELERLAAAFAAADRQGP